MVKLAETLHAALALSGTPLAQSKDDALLKAITPVLDGLYVGYANASQKR